MELRDVDSGSKSNERFRTDETVESMHSTSLVAIHHICCVTHFMQNITHLFFKDYVMLLKAFAFHCVNLSSMKEII